MRATKRKEEERRRRGVRVTERGSILIKAVPLTAPHTDRRTLSHGFLRSSSHTKSERERKEEEKKGPAASTRYGW